MHFKCDDEKEVGKLRHRVLVVQHPLEKLAHFFEDEESRRQLESILDGDAATFKNLVRRIARSGKNLLEKAPSLRPYWRSCRICQAGSKPTAVVKVKHASEDLMEAMKEVGLNPHDLEDLPKVERSVSPEARRLFSQLTRTQVLDLFELYRADHELFGYDATPYLNLTIALQP